MHKIIKKDTEEIKEIKNNACNSNVLESFYQHFLSYRPLLPKNRR